jgi:4-hydroxy-3-methylbut-2-enyl diphosphate reductase IspH
MNVLYTITQVNGSTALVSDGVKTITIDMANRGTSWEFSNTPATVVTVTGGASGPDGVMQTELEDFLTTESGDFLEFEE